LQRLELRRENRANWTAVDRTVRVTACLAVHRTRIEAGAAANAVERLARFLAGQHFRASVVQQPDVEFLSTVALASAGPDRVVRVHALAGRRARQHLEKDFEIRETRN